MFAVDYELGRRVSSLNFVAEQLLVLLLALVDTVLMSFSLK